MARCFRRQRRCGFSRNTLNTSEVWSSATRRSLSRVQCCRLLDCCGSLPVLACREPISMERNCRKTIFARPLLSTRSVQRVILSISPLRWRRCTEATAVDRTDAVQSRLEQYFDNLSAENVFRGACGAFKRGPAAQAVTVSGHRPCLT